MTTTSVKEQIVEFLSSNAPKFNNNEEFTQFVDNANDDVFDSVVHLINEYWFQGYNSGSYEGLSLLPAHIVQLLKDQWRKGYNDGYTEGRSKGHYEGHHGLPSPDQDPIMLNEC